MKSNFDKIVTNPIAFAGVGIGALLAIGVAVNSFENATGIDITGDGSTPVKLAEKQAARKAKDDKAAEASRAKAHKANAKLKAEGWMKLQNGIYGRWCTNTCSTADVIGSSGYWLMEVWAKDRAAGDIYSQVNIMRDGVVVGWTNDTLYLDKGQRGILTFQKYGLNNPSSYTAQLVKFNARG